MSRELDKTLDSVRACRECASHLPNPPKPILSAHTDARVLVVGQAPGSKVHATGIPWNDPSGDNLRQWLDVSRETFYNPRIFAIIPMGFCYPGKGKSGDLPPRPECAPLWHGQLLNHLPNLRIYLLIGQYAQAYYLSKKDRKKYPTLTERVRYFRDFGPRDFPLVHPSPRNIGWQKRNPWFQAEVVPRLREAVHQWID